MTLDHFKDLSAGLESLAIVVATLLGGGWAVYQFFSLRALDKAKLDLEKAKKDLVERGVLVIDLATESFPSDRGYLLHVQATVRNVGNLPETIDWKKTAMFARRFHKTGEGKIEMNPEMHLGVQAPDTALNAITFAPGYLTSQSFLLPIPQPGVYFVEFMMHASPMVRADVLSDMAKAGTTAAEGTFIIWNTNKFVSVPQEQTIAVPAKA
jgi:hypothetical protein